LGLNVVNPLSIAWNSAYSEAFVVDLVPVALAANTIDGVEPSNTAALSIGEDLVGSTANYAKSSLISISWGTAADSSNCAVGGVSRAFSAGTIDAVGLSSTPAGAINDVVDLIGWAGHSANLEADIEVGVVRTGLADTVDSVVVFLANAGLVNKDLVWFALAWGDWQGSWG